MTPPPAPLRRGGAAPRDNAPNGKASGAGEKPAKSFTRRQKLGLLLAPVAVVSLWLAPAPTAMTAEMRVMGALTVAMALLWICESIPLAATALLPLVILPLAGIAKPAEAAQSYAGDLIFLFIGGFILANGVERWGLHRRVAFWILSVAGKSKPHIVGGLMATTAFISLWISNTAAALLMMPVGLSVVNAVADGDGEGNDDNFGAAMVLGKPRLPIIINSAYSSYKDNFLSWAADAYVCKSSDLSELKARIRESLDNRVRDNRALDNEAPSSAGVAKV